MAAHLRRTVFLQEIKAAHLNVKELVESSLAVTKVGEKGEFLELEQVSPFYLQLDSESQRFHCSDFHINKVVKELRITEPPVLPVCLWVFVSKLFMRGPADCSCDAFFQFSVSQTIWF